MSTVTIHSPAGLTAQERLRCALRSTDAHIFMEGSRVTVVGPDDKGNLRELGHFDPAITLAVHGPTFQECVQRVRFGCHARGKD